MKPLCLAFVLLSACTMPVASADDHPPVVLPLTDCRAHCLLGCDHRCLLSADPMPTGGCYCACLVLSDNRPSGRCP